MTLNSKQDALKQQDSTGVAPLLYSKAQLASRISYFLKLWSLKIFSKIGFKIIRTLKPTPDRIRPSFLRAYPCRSHLRNRIFIPRSRKPWEELLYISMYTLEDMHSAMRSLTTNSVLRWRISSIFSLSASSTVGLPEANFQSRCTMWLQ